MNYKLVYIKDELPTVSGEYFTEIGKVKYSQFNKTFYISGEPVIIEQWFKEIRSFQDSADVVMKYLSDRTHPHTKMIIDCSYAELLEGVKSHINEEFIKQTK